MATNANTDDKAVDDSTKPVTEEDLRALKYGEDGVETTQNVEDEPAESEETEDTADTGEEEEGQTQDQIGEDSTGTEESDQFIKELPNISGDTLEDYARSLEKAYQASTAEALRLKGLVDTRPNETPNTETVVAPEIDISDPLQLYAKQKMDSEIQDAYATFSKDYPQVSDPTEYINFTNEVAVLYTILQSQKRLASPQELYQKAAVILGWEKQSGLDNKEKLGAAVKNTAAVTKTSSGKLAPTKSKITEAMMIVNRKMYPGKSDAEIRKELEPYIT